MKTELRLRLIFLKICSFMIKQVHSFHPFAQLRKRRRIAAICVAPWFIGQISGIFISDDQRFISTGMPYEAIEECSPFVKPCRTDYISAGFQCPDFRLGKPIFFQGVLTDIHLRDLLPDHISVCLNPMIQRECQDLQRLR